MMLPVSAPVQLSKYQLLEEIGHGGMATVYRARDTRLDRDIALKLIHRHLRQSSEIEARFDSEARAIARLRHPNIVEVYDVSEPHEDERYLIMELVRGCTLRQWLEEHGAVPAEIGAVIVLEIASALEHAHREGVVHRDVKPENVLLEIADLCDCRPSKRGLLTLEEDPDEPAKPSDEQLSSTSNERASVPPPPRALEETAREDASGLEAARVKLTDFGIAKLLDAQGVTSTGQVLGSPAHMAPEQIEGNPIDVRSDVFSLGVLFYELVVGALPFAGTNPAQVLRNVLDARFLPADRVRPKIGAGWTRMISRCLARKPDDRYASVTELARDVRKELEALGLKGTRRELVHFFVDPVAEGKELERQVVNGLQRDATRALQAKDIERATEQLCRALAYRPKDAALLRRVASLRRQDRIRSMGKKLLSAAVLVGAVSAATYVWVGQRSGDGRSEVSGSRSSAPKAQPPSQSAASTGEVTAAAPSVNGSAATRPEPVNPAKTQRKAKTRRAPTNSKPAPEPEKRAVSIRISGATGGTVRIDGVEQPWFGGVTHQLPVGLHRFQFIPPDETCCVATEQLVEIVPGQGTQLVTGRIPFETAGIGVDDPSSEGWRLACPSLFSGSLALPGRRTVDMSSVTASGVCTFTSSGATPDARSVRVQLRAGNTTLLPWTVGR